LARTFAVSHEERGHRTQLKGKEGVTQGLAWLRTVGMRSGGRGLVDLIVGLTQATVTDIGRVT
jgi:hypothetical protein